MIRTHTRRDSPLNGTEREGGTEGGRESFSLLLHALTERNVMESQKRTERSDREGEIEKEMK